jgi:hypothetical protein
MMRTLTLGSAFVLLLAAVASAQPAKLDPCGLLTPAEIKAAVDFPPFVKRVASGDRDHLAQGETSRIVKRAVT